MCRNSPWAQSTIPDAPARPASLQSRGSTVCWARVWPPVPPQARGSRRSTRQWEGESDGSLGLALQGRESEPADDQAQREFLAAVIARSQFDRVDVQRERRALQFVDESAEGRNRTRGIDATFQQRIPLRRAALPLRADGAQFDIVRPAPL